MADSVRPGEDVARGASATVFVSDPSAEAERVAQALRSAGFGVVDVPLSMLVARVAVQRPSVILIDVDADGALDAIARVRELPDSDEVDIVFFGRVGAAMASAEDAIAYEASAFFERPVDVGALLAKVEALAGVMRPPLRPSAPPPALPAAASVPVAFAVPHALSHSASAAVMSGPASPSPSDRAAALEKLEPAMSSENHPQSNPPSASASLPPPSMRAPDVKQAASVASRATPMPLRPPPSTSFASPPGMEIGPPSMRRATSVQAPLSNELEALLQEAEQRIGGQMGRESMLPSPEEEIEAVLPAEVLASLDEPIDDEDEDEFGDAQLGAMSRSTTTGAGRVTTGGGASGSTGGGGTGPGSAASLSDAASASVVPATGSGRLPEDAIVAPPKTHSGTHAGTHAGSQVGVYTTGARVSGTSEVQRREDASFAQAQRPLVDRADDRADRVADRESPTPPPPALHAAGSSHPPPPTMGTGMLGIAAIAPQRPPIAPIAPAAHVAAAVPASRPIPVIPSVLGPGDAPRALAQAIASRATGVLTFESTGGMRRAVLREGDLVTAASGLDDENLLAFLAARGELPRDRVEQLSGKLPPFGRHAGAALVAHGYLRQDQLWAVLRAHAEWILARIVALDTGSAILEPDAQGRLRNEPSVFGGSTGAEVLVEVIRRVVAPSEAVARLGGDTSRIADGPNESLQSECALHAAELDFIANARGRTLADILSGAHESDIASVLYALVLLGVLETIRAANAPRVARHDDRDRASHALDPLDEEAIRARVRARMQLVDEGDYFAVLGVSRDATGYEVKRAFLELRRAFEPSRILTPSLADLQNDVRKIASVLDEAYEILRDAPRRDRYRRAIEATPRI